MNKSLEGGYGHWVVLVIGIILVLMLVGFFKSGSENTITKVTYKSILRLPCGLTVNEPKDKSKISFPITVKGYINGCGWEAVGNSAGTAQVFDGNGMPLTSSIPLIVPPDSTGMPYYFEGTIKLLTPPKTDSGSLIIHGSKGLTNATELKF
jgi:hypothetical protein